MSTVNLYDVLDISPESTIKEIKEAYRKLAKEFHPDKPNGNSEMFELVTHAFNILSNGGSRREYDKLYKANEQSGGDHHTRASSAKQYYDSQESDTKKRPKEKINEDFKMAMMEMDRKRGYKRSDTHEKEIPEKDFSKRWNDKELERRQEEIEYTPDELFDPKHPVDWAKFNDAFDKMYGQSHSLIPHDGNPNAFNMMDGKFGSSFTPLDKIDDTFADEDPDTDLGNSMFSSIKAFEPRRKLSKSDVHTLKGADYTKGHNKMDKDFNKTLEQRMRERDMDTRKFDERTMEDFDPDDSCGGYGIFKSIGLKDDVGRDDGNIKSAYDKMVEMRRRKANKKY